MARLRITRLGHGGVLYRSPGEKWLWVDRWSGSPNYTPPPQPHRVDVVAPTPGPFDHVGNDPADVGELPAAGGAGAGAGSPNSRTAPASTTPATPICSATWRSSASAGHRPLPCCRSAGTTPWVRALPPAPRPWSGRGRVSRAPP